MRRMLQAHRLSISATRCPVTAALKELHDMPAAKAQAFAIASSPATPLITALAAVSSGLDRAGAGAGSGARVGAEAAA